MDADQEAKLKQARGNVQRLFQEVERTVLESDKSLIHFLIRARRAGMTEAKAQEVLAGLEHLLRDARQTYEVAIAMPALPALGQSRVNLAE
ncbi:MAG: hypothetical protein ACYC0F_18035 [Rhodanobacter sp.]